MGPDFATSENKLMTCSSSLASEGIAVAEPQMLLFHRKVNLILQNIFSSDSKT